MQILAVLPYFLLVAVVGVGLLGFFAIMNVQRKAFRQWRSERRRRRAYAEKVAKVERIGAAPYTPTTRPLAAPVPLQRGELTSVFRTLEESTRFGKIAAPPPVPARARLPRGSVPPPIPAARPAPARQAPRSPRSPAHATAYGVPIVRPR